VVESIVQLMARELDGRKGKDSRLIPLGTELRCTVPAVPVFTRLFASLRFAAQCVSDLAVVLG
jgi:hypothetical protein